MESKTKIVEVGNSLGIIIPKVYVDYYGWSKGSEVTIIEKKSGVLITSPIQDKDKGF